MTDMNYDEIGTATSAPMGRGMQKLVTSAGALTSVALIVGLALWGYRLMVRDVSGVPVVRAIEGPMRLAPVDPGGKQADHQGLAVNRVAAEGTAAQPAERLLLAPGPVTLTAEDAPRAKLRPMLREISASVAGAPTNPDAVARALATVGRLSGDAAGETVESDASVAVALVPDTAPVPLVAPVAVVASVAARPGIIAADVPGVSASPRPMPRPDGDLMAKAALRSASVGSLPISTQDVVASAVVAGTELVQLGAFDTPGIARAEWERLSAKFDSLMNGKQRLVMAAVSGERTFYRLRAVGFSDLSDARRFCAALRAEQAGCIPVVAR